MPTIETRRRLSPAQRRVELLDALAGELAVSAWHAISVPMVVQRAGVSQGLFYRYFSDLDEAFVALVKKRVVPRLVDAGTRLRLDVSDGDELESVLTDWFEAFARLAADEGPLVRASLLAAPTGTGPAADFCRTLIDDLRSWGEGLLAPVSGTGPYREVNPRLVSHMVVGMTVQCALTGLDGMEPRHWAVEMARFEAGGLLRRLETQPHHDEGEHRC